MVCACASTFNEIYQLVTDEGIIVPIGIFLANQRQVLAFHLAMSMLEFDSGFETCGISHCLSLMLEKNCIHRHTCTVINKQVI